MNDRGRAVVAELQQDELPSVDRVHEKTDHPRRGRTPAGEERERGSQNDLSHRPVPMRIKRKEKHRSTSQSSSRGITPDPHVKRFNPQTDGLAALYHCLIRLYKASGDGTITWNDLRSLYRKDVGRSFNTEELNHICGTTRRTKHQLLQTKLHKLIEPVDTKGLILRIVHTEDGVPVPLPSPISSDDDAGSTFSRMTSTEDEELSKMSMEERRRELTESLVKQGLLKKSGERMSATYNEEDSPVEETETSIHVEKVDESEGSETEVRERVFNSLMKNFAQIEELEKALEETDAIQERLNKTLAETNEVEAHIEATRRSPSPTASCHTIEEEEIAEEEPATLSPKRSSTKRRKHKKANGFAISEEPEEAVQPVEIVETAPASETAETLDIMAISMDELPVEGQPESVFHIPVYSEELADEQMSAPSEEDVKEEETVSPCPERRLEREQAVDDAFDYPTDGGVPMGIPIISVTEYFEEDTGDLYPEDQVDIVEYEEPFADGTQEDQEVPVEYYDNWSGIPEYSFTENPMDYAEYEEQSAADESQKAPGGESSIEEEDDWKESRATKEHSLPIVETVMEEEEETHAPVETEPIPQEAEKGQIAEETPELEQTAETTKLVEEIVNKAGDEQYPLSPQPAPRRSLDNTQENIGDQDEKVEKKAKKPAAEVKEEFLTEMATTAVFSELPITPALYYPEQSPSPSSPPVSPRQLDGPDPFAGFDYTRKSSNSKQAVEAIEENRAKAPVETAAATRGAVETAADVERPADKLETKENVKPKEDDVKGDETVEIREMGEKEQDTMEKTVADEAGPSRAEYVPITVTKKTTYSVVQQNQVRTITLCQSLPPESPATSASQDEQSAPSDRQPVPVHKTSTIEVELAQSEEEFKDTFGFLNELPSSSSRTNKVADIHVATLSPTRDLEKRDITVSPVKRKKRWCRRWFCCS